jgi:USP6 N-terminal-like protein
MDYAVTFIDLKDVQMSTGCCYALIDIGADVSLMYQFNEKRHKDFEESRKNEQYDEYGFLKDSEWWENKLDTSFPSYKQYQTSREALKKKESYRVAKFKTMIHTMEKNPTAIPGKLKNRIRKGVPNSIRGDLWRTLIPIKDLKEQNKGAFQKHILERTDQKTAIQHDKDINRNFRSHKNFRERFGPWQIKLFNVLKAYANYNQDLGYTQGIDSIASMLLIYLEDEEDTFWALVHLMAQPKYLMGDVFLPGFPKLMEDFYIQKQIVSEILPQLHKKFDEEMLNDMISAYATTWYMLAFIQDLPFDVVLRIWDIYINEGTKIIFNTSIGLLRMYEKDLLSMDMEKILKFLKSFQTRPVDPELLIKYAVKDKVKRNLILKHQADYKKQKLLDDKKRRERK